MNLSLAHARTMVTGLLTTALLGISDPAVPQQSSNQSAVVEPAPIPAARAPRPGEYGAAFDAQHYDISLTLPPCCLSSVESPLSPAHAASTPLNGTTAAVASAPFMKLRRSTAFFSVVMGLPSG